MRDERSFLTLGVPLGRFTFPPRSGNKVEARAHLLLVIMLPMQLLGNVMREQPPLGAPFLAWLVSAITLAASILLHELGHVLAAVRAGGRGARIVLWPLGGLVPCEVPEDPKAELSAAAGGLLTSSIICAGASVICISAGWELLPGPEPRDTFPFAQAFTEYTVLWNAFLFILNLLPCQPLDGGKILEAFVWHRTESQWVARSFAVRVGFLAALFAAVLAAILIVVSLFMWKEFSGRHPLLFELSWGLATAAFAYYLFRKLEETSYQEEEGEKGLFGYDFSRGYTSLEGSLGEKGSSPSLLSSVRSRRLAKKQARREAEEAEMKERVDELLKKIHEQGIESLTPSERKYLEKASKGMRTRP